MNLRHFNSIVRQVLVLPILGLVLVAAALYWQVQTSSHTVTRIQESDATISQTNLVGRLIVDEETGLRGYQSTKDKRFLDPCTKAFAELPQAFDRLATLRLNAAEQKQVAQLRNDHAIWVEAFARPVIAMTEAAGDESLAARDVGLNMTGKVLMDKIRLDIQELVQAAEEHRGTRVSRWRGQVERMIWGLLALSVVVGVLIGLFVRNRLHVVSKAYQTSLDTLRHKTEEIYHSEQQLRTTLSSIGDGVITCDSAGDICSLNPVASELTGWSIDEALGRPLRAVFKIVDETTREQVEDPVSKVKRLDRTVDLANHTILIRKDGSELNIDDSGAPIRNKHGNITGVVLVFRDVTIKKRTQEALIANEKLAVTGRLAASIAHEIHNPLDSVINILYLISSGSSPEETKQFLAMAQQELARVTQISRSMLSLYRESSVPVAVNMKEAIDGTLILLDHRINNLHSKISVDVADDLSVAGFPAELRQVFTNLVVNAVEAAGPEGHIEISGTYVPPGNTVGGTRQKDGVLIEIADNGAGISESDSARLFQPFFSTKGEQGTGLGLWVSRGIVRKHGGSIELQSRADTSGAVARVFLATHPTISPGAD